jgi:hypothetical protein
VPSDPDDGEPGGSSDAGPGGPGHRERIRDTAEEEPTPASLRSGVDSDSSHALVSDAPVSDAPESDAGGESVIAGHSWVVLVGAE